MLLIIVLGCSFLLVLAFMVVRIPLAEPKGWMQGMGQLAEKADDSARNSLEKAKGYWDRFDFHDTYDGLQMEAVNAAFMGYIQLLNKLPNREADRMIGSLLDEVERRGTGRLYRHFLELFENYLYKPNALMPNELRYAAVLWHMRKSPFLNGDERQMARKKWQLLHKNIPGSTAEDVVFILPNGHKSRLHQLQSPYTILFFYQGPCRSCMLTAKRMKMDERLERAIKGRQLTVLTVMVDDSIASWEEVAPQLSPDWINVFDQNEQIRKSGRYDLTAMPAIYLLNKDKRVLLKDASWELLAFYLEKLVVVDS